MKTIKPNIVLLTLPFWSPLIPAQGIAHLKNYLKTHGFKIFTADLTAEEIFLEYYREYFNCLSEIIPEEKRGNFYNVGHDILRGHLEAFNNKNIDKSYYNLIEKHIYYNFYLTTSLKFIRKLDNIVASFYKQLATYITELLFANTPDVLGLSVNSGNIGPSVFVFKLAKKLFPNIRNVMGGSIYFNHLSYNSPDFNEFIKITDSYIDNYIIGKGEVLLHRILENKFPQQKKVFTNKDMTDEEITICSNNLPDMSDYKLDKYLYLAASASSSCPNNCSFCNVNFFFGPHKKKDVTQTVKEMKRLQDNYGHILFFMTDSLLNTVITGLAEELIKNQIKVYMDGYFRIDEAASILKNTLLWRQGGFYRARIGTESGSQKILDFMGKNITPELTRKAILGLAEAGIKTTTYWVVGHPEETDEDFQMTLDLIAELKDYIYQAECNPFTYYYLGQASTNEWFDKKYLLYSDEIRDMLYTQTWCLDLYPQREIIYKRVQQFGEHCRQLNIPNPYTISEINHADNRWKQLHIKSVPSIIEINNMEKALNLKNNKAIMVQVEANNNDIGNFDFEDF